MPNALTAHHHDECGTTKNTAIPVFSKAVRASKPGMPQYTAHRLPESRKTCLQQKQDSATCVYEGPTENKYINM